MTRRELLTRPGRWALLVPFLLACWLLVQEEAVGRQSKPKVLLIGTSGSLSSGSRSREEAAMKKLKSFIKDETGFDSKIVRQKGWRELTKKMADGKLHLGVFQGDEFAWAREKHAKLQPLALGVNVDRYPVASVVTRRDSKISRFADLRGKNITMPSSPPHFLRTFLYHQCGKKPEDFFAKMKYQENVEDALDDVVDGVVQAGVVERASLEAYRRRKPGRFKQLKELVRSQPFPPVIIAAYDNVLDESTRRRFRTGLHSASRKERGRMMLTLFRLTGFEPAPADFSKVVARTQKTYPPPKEDKE